jgi:hypothetical protein
VLRPGDLTPTDMAELMQKLASNFGGKKDLEARTSTYYEKLERFPVDVVRRAVDRVLDETHKYFPLVGHIKKHCVEIEQELGIVDDSPRARQREWEANPWADVEWTALERQGEMPSSPCPTCGALLEWSPRGWVVVHDDEKHAAAKLGYSNVGRPEWWNLGPPVMPPSKKSPLKLLPAPAAAEQGDAYEETAP